MKNHQNQPIKKEFAGNTSDALQINELGNLCERFRQRHWIITTFDQLSSFLQLNYDLLKQGIMCIYNYTLYTHGSAYIIGLRPIFVCI